MTDPLTVKPRETLGDWVARIETLGFSVFGSREIAAECYLENGGSLPIRSDPGHNGVMDMSSRIAKHEEDERKRFAERAADYDATAAMLGATFAKVYESLGMESGSPPTEGPSLLNSPLGRLEQIEELLARGFIDKAEAAELWTEGPARPVEYEYRCALCQHVYAATRPGCPSCGATAETLAHTRALAAMERRATRDAQAAEVENAKWRWGVDNCVWKHCGVEQWRGNWEFQTGRVQCKTCGATWTQAEHGRRPPQEGSEP